MPTKQTHKNSAQITSSKLSFGDYHTFVESYIEITYAKLNRFPLIKLCKKTITSIEDRIKKRVTVDIKEAFEYMLGIFFRDYTRGAKLQFVCKQTPSDKS